MIGFIISISLLLESILSNLIPIGTYFTPLFSIVSLVIIYPYFINDDIRYIKYCGITDYIRCYFYEHFIF